jgi:Tfp pilus assembly protein PilF
MIHRAAGEPERAREFLRRALALNPHFHVLHAEVAERTLKEIGRP